MTNYKDSAIVSTTITRPSNATAYLANDVISTKAGSVLTFSNATKLSGSKIIVINANIMINVDAVPSGMDEFRLHLYSSAPTAIADNEAFNLPEDDRSKYLGFVTISTANDFGDTVYVQSVNTNKIVNLVDTTDIYGILETVDAFTPSSGDVFTVSMGILGAVGV